VLSLKLNSVFSISSISPGRLRGIVTTEVLLLSASAYVLGSINFAILVMKGTGRGDPREKFSGNSGATNVYRQAGLFWAAVVLLLDLGRALLFSLLSIQWTGITLTPWVGLFLLLGNRFPCFHQFRGGKGVGSYIGITAALSPFTSALSCLVWVAGYAVFRIPFMASLGMILVLAAGSMLAVSWDSRAVIGIGLTTAFLLANHWPNIKNHFGLK
jgi:glycerol-3-phosphate acyltransferase PlsY